MSKTRALYVRVPVELHDRLVEIATSAGVSVALATRLLLERAIGSPSKVAQILNADLVPRDEDET